MKTTSELHGQQQGHDDRASVLVVEDDRTLLSVMKYNLEREGYRVWTAGTGTRAAEIATEHPEIDVVLLDIMLPELNGLALLPQLRRLTVASVLIVSARGEEQDRIDGLELGADDYIVKPFGLRELLARVRAAVRRRGRPDARPPATLFRGALRVELDRRMAYVNDTPLRLRPKEFGVLAALAMEPGKIFARNELLDRVWGQDVIVDERTVDVHVSWLRSKLIGARAPSDLIQTVHGAGYRFVDRGALASLAERDEVGPDLVTQQSGAIEPAPEGCVAWLARESVPHTRTSCRHCGMMSSRCQAWWTKRLGGRPRH